MTSPEESELSTSQLAELSALADGSLDPARRPEVEARIAASPELSERLAREVGVVGMLHRARAEDRAPAALRARIDAQRPTRGVAARRRGGYGLLTAGALAVIVLILVLAIPSGTPGSPSVSQAAALATRGMTGQAPGLDPTRPSTLLAVRIQDITFPNWNPNFGWRAVGQRRDRLGDRQVVTVYYEWHGARAAYTIVSAPALAQVRGHQVDLDNYELHTLTLGGRIVVTWRRAGHTCVLSAVGVPAAELRKLAASNG